MRSKTTAIAAAIAVLALSLSACGGTGQQSGSSSGSKALSYEDSPLSKMFSSASGVFSGMPDDEQQAEWAETNRKIEESVAKCMADEGFEYTPIDFSAGSITYGGDYEDTTTVEWAEQNGYGFAPITVESPDQDVSEVDAIQDPNLDRYEKMSASEKTAYDLALNGKQSQMYAEGDTEVEVEYNWEDAGCYGAASNEWDTSGDIVAVYEDPQWAELLASMNSLYEKAASSPKVIELNANWANCMADAGIPALKEPMDATDLISEKYDEFWEESADNPDATVDPALRAEEIKTAVADATCKKKFDYNDASMRIQFELEQEFINTNKAELEALMAAIEQADSK